MTDTLDAAALVRGVSPVLEDAGTADVVAVLHGWMAADQKIAPLKTLQGLIWQRGYADGDLTTEFFPDVAPALRAWHAAGPRLAVFSSGSVAGQVASFSRTTDGDVTSLFSQHFDTVNAGPKREEPSYRAIAAALAAEPGRVVFFSDVPAELHAAAAADWQTIGVARPGEPFGDADFSPHQTVATFEGVEVLP